jgi:PAS domain S-box-containing protein
MFNDAVLRWMNDLSARGIFITDAELNVRAWNQWLEARTGRSAAEVVGRSLLELYPDLVERGLDRQYRDALTGQVMFLSYRLHRYLLPITAEGDGASLGLMQQSARIGPLVEDDRVIGTITVIDDVTERIAREEQLVRLLAREQSARRDAEAANRMKDEFLATVSHELRTPLNAIAGWIQIIRKKNIEPEFLAHGLDVIERNVKMQTKIIEDILDVSRIITGKLNLTVTPVDLVPIIGAALDSVQLAAEAKGIEIKWSVDSKTGPVSGDPSRLQQVVWNLVSNAIKFTPAGGIVEVRLARVGSQAEIRVSDNGKGISGEFLPYVFERFRQADSTSARQHSGLGLGLAIVRHLVEMHGGTIQAESAGEGLGATFTVRLPLITIQKSKAVAESAHRAQGDGGEPATGNMGETPLNNMPRLDGLRALVVDDELDAREMLRVLLVHFGAEVKTSGSAQEALSALESWGPDVLISDVGMPDQDGYSLIYQVREREPERGGQIPAIALTGYSAEHDRAKLIEAGYHIHMSKPVEADQLVEAILSLTGKAGKSHYNSAE